MDGPQAVICLANYSCTSPARKRHPTRCWPPWWRGAGWSGRREGPKGPAAGCRDGVGRWATSISAVQNWPSDPGLGGRLTPSSISFASGILARSLPPPTYPERSRSQLPPPRAVGGLAHVSRCVGVAALSRGRDDQGMGGNVRIADATTPWRRWFCFSEATSSSRGRPFEGRYDHVRQLPFLTACFERTGGDRQPERAATAAAAGIRAQKRATPPARREPAAEGNGASTARRKLLPYNLLRPWTRKTGPLYAFPPPVGLLPSVNLAPSIWPSN